MKQARSLLVSLIALSLLLIGVLPTFSEKLPSRCLISSVPYVKQLTNYCGPATLTTVLKYWQADANQESVGEEVYDSSIKATNGADMMLYARKRGFSAYSWNSSLADLKEKLALGIPVIVLQDTSVMDRSGHYRVVTGYDETAGVVYVSDPYEPDKKQIDYNTFLTLWQRHGNWSLLVCPANRDVFKQDLDEKNPVVHIDLAYIYYKRGDNKAAEKESRLALALEPQNYSAQMLLSKAISAAGTHSEADKSDGKQKRR
ncbi:MAG: C39 family peptidase [Armatimonadota bacterium]